MTKKISPADRLGAVSTPLKFQFLSAGLIISSALSATHPAHATAWSGTTENDGYVIRADDDNSAGGTESLAIIVSGGRDASTTTETSAGGDNYPRSTDDQTLSPSDFAQIEVFKKSVNLNVDTTISGGTNKIGTENSENTLTGTTNTLDGTSNIITGTTNTITGTTNTITGTTTTITGTTTALAGTTNTITGTTNTITGTTNTITGTTNTITGTTSTITGTTSASLQAGSGSNINSISLTAGNSGTDAAVNISGTLTTGSTATIGVLIKGSAQNGAADPATGATPTWSDVSIQSANFDATAKTGSAINITDFGVQIITPQPLAGETINNSQGGNTTAGVVNNNYGMNAGSGTVNNQSGGNSGSGVVSNAIGSNTGSGTIANSFGQNDGTGVVTNSFGTGTGVSNNSFGNTNAATIVSMQAGSSSSTMKNGVNTMSVAGGGGTGTSVLSNATAETNGFSGIVLSGSTASHVIVDAKGKISTRNGTVAESTAAMTLTNGLGNTHGLVVTERQATLSGGTTSSSLTLNDSGATFSNSATGAAVQLHGVADGTSDYDAVNLRQLNRGVAAAMATAPLVSLAPGESGIGIGSGYYGGSYALGVSMAHMSRNGTQLNFAVAGVPEVRSTLAVRLGVGWKW